LLFVAQRQTKDG